MIDECVVDVLSTFLTSQRLCLSQNDTMDDRQETIIGDRLESVEGLAYDWMSHNIYWVDASRNPKIEIARADGTHRRVLINDTWLDKPRAIALAPRHGYKFKYISQINNIVTRFKV